MEESFSNSKYPNEQYDLIAEETDPLLDGGYQIIYDKNIPIEIRDETNGRSIDEVGTLQNLNIKILIIPAENSYSEIRIQLSSETDLFFQYFCYLDQKIFAKLKKQQSLNISFQQITQMLIKLINLAQKDPNHNFAVLFITKNGHVHLDFIQNMQYKFIQIISLNFTSAQQDLNKQCVSYRFNLLKRKMITVQNALYQISSMIKIKNPSLLLQIQKSSSHHQQHTKKQFNKSFK